MSSDRKSRAPDTATPGGAGRVDLARISSVLPQLIDSLGEAVLVVDATHRIVAANRRYAEVFHLNPHMRPGDPCSSIENCPERLATPEGDRCATCEIFAGGRPSRRIRIVAGPRGARRRWEGTFSPIMGPGGAITHVVEVWRDVSERSQLESQLGHSERLASLGVLAAGVAHEINNPLAAILAGVESLERWIGTISDEVMDTERARDAEDVLRVLERETRRCREITDKLMLLAQPFSTAPVWVDLNRAADDTLQLLRYQMQKQSVTAKADLAKDLPSIWAKETSVRSVCMNLLMNAVQAMPSGGNVTVRTLWDHVSTVTLEIADTGPGIAPEHMDRIWDPFFTTKPTGQGTGLGLSITLRIVARHGGSIHAENLDSGGARFTVELPVEGPGGTGVG
jgi:signal transduction histidine kinase